MLRKKLKWHVLFERREQLEDLLVGKATVLHESGFGTVLLAKSNNNFYAFKNKCPHQRIPLEDSTIDNGFVVCPLHKCRFSCEDGRGHGRNHRLRLGKYELKFENNRVLIGKKIWTLF